MKLALLCFFLAVNLAAFLFYGMDKRRAIKGKYRISERTLILFAVFGGSIGALLGMYVFHHKTRKPKFRFGVPLILVLQIALATFIVYKCSL